MGTQANTVTKVQNELLPNIIKIIKILWAYRLITKIQRIQIKVRKQQSTAHNSKNNTWTNAAYEQKSSKFCEYT